VVFLGNDVVSSESQTKDSLGVKNTVELEVSGTTPKIPINIRSLYRLEVDKQHEELRRSARSTSRGKTVSRNVLVPPKTIEFWKVIYQERRKIGSFKNTIEDHSRYVVLEEVIATPVQVSFNYVDEVKDGYSFADLYKKTFPNQSVPIGPRKPSATPKPAPTPAPVPQPAPAPQPQPVPQPAPVPQPTPTPAPVSVPAVTPRPATITPSTVSYVSTTSGAAFKEVEDGLWQELSDTGTVRFNYEVIDIDEDCVYLLDIDRGILIELDLTRNVVGYSPDLDTEPFDLYTISSKS